MGQVFNRPFRQVPLKNLPHVGTEIVTSFKKEPSHVEYSS